MASAGPAGTEAERQLREVGEHPVDSSIVCVVTRFRLRSARYLLPSYRDYRRVLRAARRSRTPGLLRAAFLIESPTTWYSLSIWSDEKAIAHFGTAVPGHVQAADRVFGRLGYGGGSEPEIWSTKWRLRSVSGNLKWEGLDLRGAILSMGAGGDPSNG